MTIKIELSREQALAFLTFLEDAPRQNTVVEDASSLIRVALRKALGIS